MIRRPYLNTSIFMDLLDPGKRFFEGNVTPHLVDANGSLPSIEQYISVINTNLRRIANAL